MSLFSLLGDTAEARFAKAPEAKIKRTKLEILLKEKELLGFFLTGHPMDAYREILQRLSCVSLKHIENLDHDAVFRAALIIESADVRVSSKTQRKFAILMVSDGMDRYELPIWSDLYEEKNFLLKENQLIYAVMQVDKKEDSPKLSCRWLDDLTHANEAMIEACDQAFDKAKLQAARFAKMKTNEAAKPKTSAPIPAKEVKKTGETMPTHLALKIDADQIRLSHILKLKALFTDCRGETPVHLEFQSSGQTVGTIQIESRWGIDLNSSFKEALAHIPHVAKTA